ncbi:FkbM family methyltransferase [Propionibacteriaceae bacterium Y1700]|uniref:FkbM family methyltransferase n=1 Tax=Microlunatus sp. Y1700 TaxID=3418487 RepID=UPI003DA7886D
MQRRIPAKRVFLDIGAHTGETLSVVRAPRWRFDRVVCFEPAPPCWPTLESMVDERVEVCRFGLWDRTELVALNNPGAVGASVARDKDVVEQQELCEFRDAADWFSEHLSADDNVFVKINVEGAEAEIIDRLHQAGQLGKINHLLIHFDVRKAPSRQHLERQVRNQLTSSQIDYQSADEILFGGVLRGTRNWLLWCEANPRWRDARYKVLRRWEHAVRVRLYPLKLALSRRGKGSGVHRGSATGS